MVFTILNVYGQLCFDPSLIFSTENLPQTEPAVTVMISTFVDVEGTKEVKRMINLLAITVNLYHEIDADPSGSGSETDRVRKQQMLIKYT